jgi:hypothetical protein
MLAFAALKKLVWYFRSVGAGAVSKKISGTGAASNDAPPQYCLVVLQPNNKPQTLKYTLCYAYVGKERKKQPKL